jgi:hypothetical protein
MSSRPPARAAQLKRGALGGRHSNGGPILIKRAVIDSQLSTTTLKDTLRRASAVGETRRMPDPLRAEWVDTLTFKMDSHGTWHILPSALRNSSTIRGPSIDVDARLRILQGSNVDSSARVAVSVGPTIGTWVGIVGGPLLVLGLGVYQLAAAPPSVGAFLLLAGFSCLMAGVSLLRAQSVVNRAWPGLLVEVRRLAEGTLYVPAA